MLRGAEDNWLCQNGQWVKHGNPSAPAPTTGCGESPQSIVQSPEQNTNEESVVEPNIVVMQPQAGAEISSPLVVTGKARVFENQFSYRLKDSAGTVIVEGPAYASSPDAGQFGPFRIETKFSLPKTPEGTLEVFDASAKDGTEIDKVVIPVTFKGVEVTTIKLYFNNDKLDPSISCNQVFPVARKIAKTSTPARATMEELLKGPTEDEKTAGFYTTINPGVKINKLTIGSNDVAKIDFDAKIQEAVGGSCRVSSIRAEITETLKQFFSVKSVVISVDGNVEEALQP